jgi:uncharacterized DUF497 family protein
MVIEFDPAKNRRNIALRGLAFDRVSDFDFDTAWIVEDDRRDYGEVRIGPLAGWALMLLWSSSRCAERPYG